MTTYNLKNNCLIQVRHIKVNNRRIANPPDALVVENGLGYPLQKTPQPEYDPETHYLLHTYRQEADAIVEVWTVKEIEQPEPEPEPTPEPEPDGGSELNTDQESDSEGETE